jgi:hypothetical protein
MFDWLKRKIANKEIAHPDEGMKTEEHTFNGKPILIRKHRFKTPRHVMAEDTLILKLYGQRRTFPIENSIRVDEAFTFVIEDELGYKSALIGGFGQVGD